jgi:hypothetical protein
MRYNQLIPSFNAGELSPYLDARVDVQQYGSGCQTLENFITLPYGGVIRRPGTEYLGTAKSASGRVRLIPFNFSTGTRFIIELGHLYARFWSNGAQVKISTTPVEVVTPYTEAQLREVQFAQINDVIYFAHGSHMPQKLSRVSDTSWTWAVVAPSFPALLDRNADRTKTITCARTDATAATQPAGTAVTLTASTSIFLAGHVGSVWEISHTRQDLVRERTLARNGSGRVIRCQGLWQVTTVGVWQGTFAVERSFDNGSTWEDVRTYTGDGSRNIQSSGTEPVEVLLRLNVLQSKARNKGAKAFLEVVEPEIRGTVLIGAVTSGTVATGTVQREVYAGILGFISGFEVAKGGRNYTSAPTVTISAPPTGGTYATAEAEMTGYVFGTPTITDGGSDYTEEPRVKFIPDNGSPGSGAQAEARINGSGEVAKIKMLERGEGYEEAPDVVISGKNGTGDDATATCEIKYRVAAIRIIEEGSGYTSIPTIGFTGGAGENAVASAIVTLNTNAGPTAQWAEAAWSGVQGYPKTVAFHEGRLFFAGTTLRPLGVWGSAVDDYENFRTGATEADAIFLSIAGQDASSIQWIVSKSGELVIGTASQEGVIGPADNGGLSAFSATWTPRTRYGSALIQPVIAGDAILFAERSQRKLRQFLYSEDIRDFSGTDLTALAEHVTSGDIVEMSLMLQQDTILWVVRGDGQLIGMSYERGMGVTGWHRHPTLGEVESVATIFGASDDESDEVWLSVKRSQGAGQDGFVLFLCLDQTGSIGVDGAQRGIDIIDQFIGEVGTDRINGVGFVSFGDVMCETYSISSDVAAVRARLQEAVDSSGSDEGFFCDGGGDIPENGVDAINIGLNQLAATSLPGRKYIYFKTDTAGYKYQTSDPATVAARLSSEIFAAWLEFDSANTDSDDDGLYEDTFPEAGNVFHSDFDIDDVSGDIRTIERFRPGWRKALENRDAENWWYVDCGVEVINNPASATLAVPEVLEGSLVDVMSGGIYLGSYTVSGGEVTLPEAVTSAIVGLPVTSTLRPMKLNIGLNDGTSQGRKQRIHRIVARVDRSIGGQFSTNGQDWDELLSRTTDDLMDAGTPPYTGDFEVYGAGDYRDAADIWIRQTRPYPLTVVALIPKWGPVGD